MNVSGIVISSRRDREADKVIGLFSREWGRIQVRASSAAKPSGRLSALTELFVEGTFQVWVRSSDTGYGFGRLGSGKIHRSFSMLRQDVERFILASEVCRVVRLLTPLAQPSPEKHALLSEALETLCDVPHAAVPLAFAARFLTLAGFGRPKTYASEGDRAFVEKFVRLSHLRGLSPLRFSDARQENRLRRCLSRHAAETAGLDTVLLPEVTLWRARPHSMQAV
jgi:DNA repair protein RecO